jgi:hypothetical protein
MRFSGFFASAVLAFASPAFAKDVIDPNVIRENIRILSSDTDEFPEDIDFKSAAGDVALFGDIGNDIANSKTWRNWYPAAEFRAARDASLKAAPAGAK